ncbi:MAG: HNH endonuclease [Gammaproteobacteria bacterium]|nr:HNH endonuclease [Gammaproteobacteria bacterium]
MKLSTIVVHRVVATAFHGKAPSDLHVVDHIDTNRRNNRAENLRWVTRLDNILSNPATHKRIVAAHGSIEEFLENPQRPGVPRRLGQYDWMRTVSKDEAMASRERMDRWAKSEKRPNGGLIGEWLFATTHQASPHQHEVQDVESLTRGAFQRRWKTPCEFPACPDVAVEDALHEYEQRLTCGTVFSRNQYGNSRALSAEISETDGALVVLCALEPDPVKPWAISRVTIEHGGFCHENLGSCFTKEGAEKQYRVALGLSREGGDSIDDYC